MGFINSDIDDEGQIKPDAPTNQLYHLDDDIGETKNLTREQLERAKAMHARIAELKLIKGKPAPAKKVGPDGR
ncbi:MAG: Arylsulfatase [Verrucomicrobiaceae bacterium]|nr:Arylsulfatase [Verrucomicrobiaceae bacterium]